ncbi:glycosyltransferase [candidate division KSB1 bacterium]|nr:glycosyltransferase [candidate division KSB1 bacterium]
MNKSVHKYSVLMVGAMPPQLGGIERYVGDLIASELGLHHRVIPFNLNKPLVNSKTSFKTLAGYQRSFGRGILTVLTSYAYSAFFFIKFLLFLLTKWIDIIHIHSASYTSFWEKCYYIYVGKLFGKKIVLHIHGSRFESFYEQSGGRARRWIAYFMQKCDTVIALGQYWRRFYCRFLPMEKVKVVYNGIDLQSYTSQTPKTDDPSLVFVGEVGQRKGIYDLLASLKRLQRDWPGIRLDIIGTGELDQVAQKSQIMGLKHVHLHGARFAQHKVDILCRSWCFVLPSYAEQMPLVIIEAFAAGLPVISTRIGTIPEMIDPFENGFVVNAGDVVQLAKMISLVLENETLRMEMGRKNRLKALSLYDINRCAQDIDTIYQSLKI